MLPRDHARPPLAELSVTLPQFKVAEDRTNAVKQETRKQRRKTIQTIGDLAPQYATAQELARKPSRTDNGDLSWYYGGRASLNTSKTSRRKSLPRQLISSQHGHAGNPPKIPAVPITAPALQRSSTESNHARPSNRNSAKRRSMPSSFEPRGRSLSPVAEGELSRQRIQGDNLYFLGTGRTAPRRKRSDSGLDTKEQKEGGWNARRQRDLIKRERDFVEGNAQRERERLGLSLEGPTRKASTDGLPKAKSSMSRYYTQPFPSNQAAIVDASQRQNRAIDDGRVPGRKTSSRSFLDSDPSEMNPMPGFRRSLSGAFEPRNMSYNEVFDHTVASSMVSSPCTSNHSAVSAERHLSDPRSSSSLQTLMNSTRSSSTKSNGSGVSSGTRHSERVPLSHARRPNHPLRQNPVLRSRESFPILVGASVDATAMPHPLSTSDLIMGSTRLRGPLMSQHSGLPSTCSLPSGLSRRPVRLQPQAMATGTQEAFDTDHVLYRENPDKRGLSGRRLSRQDMEEARKRAAREKVRERVKRANELEEAREKELGKEDKTKTRGSKGFLCGLFAM